jgi:hypothetical protein
MRTTKTMFLQECQLVGVLGISELFQLVEPMFDRPTVFLLDGGEVGGSISGRCHASNGRRVAARPLAK